MKKSICTVVTLIVTLSLLFSLPFLLVKVLADGSGGAYTPGDSRVNPQIGDRLAVYVNLTNIAVWGITNDNKGIFLTTFGPDDLMAASKGVTKDLGSNGKVTLRGVGDGQYTVAWLGGPYGASGQGAFVKTFKSVPLTDNSGAPFDPKDGRLVPRVNDRLAVYLSPTQIDVWGVNSENKGVWLTSLSLAEIKAAKAASITKTLAENNGTITLKGNGNGYYMLSWQGGKFGATGTGEYTMCFAYTLPTS